jgi:hypothetical protein
MMFYIEAKTSIRVAGISGPFEQVCAYLVNAPHVAIAKQKFEAQIWRDFAHMAPAKIDFEYTKIAGEIK